MTDAIKETALVKHYKGQVYHIIAFARHSETQEILVIYQQYPVEGGPITWARPEKMFFEELVIDGIKVRRFEWVKKASVRALRKWL